MIETWNIDGHAASLRRLLQTLRPQLVGVEVIITHVGLDAATRASLAAELAITWLPLPRDASYYDHKNRGFDATTGDIVAFIDGDCSPDADWLEHLVAPFARGARVVAGATSYPGALAPIANAIDFPYFDGKTAGRRSIADAPATVRNFFANNVAFERAVFALRRYPAIEPMFHGQCQVLALRLLQDGIPIAFAPDARLTHAWPDDVRAWLEARLLRGADTVSLLPYVLAHYTPRAAPAIARLGPLPTLALIAGRGIASSWQVVRRGPLMRGLGFVAIATLLDSIGAATSRWIYGVLT
ncbi:MAG: glycosyltransferase family 2 protein [Kofleriaceae bacterium]